MGVIDRTADFREFIAKLCVGGEGLTVDHLSTSLPPKAVSEVSAWAADIGEGIHNVSLKVDELRKLAKHSRIFNDRSADIHKLSGAVKMDLQMLKQKVDMLEQRATCVGSNSSYRLHSKNIVDTLKRRLLDVTRDFKVALDEGAHSLKQQGERWQIYLPRKEGSASNLSSGRALPAFGARSNDLEGGCRRISQDIVIHREYSSERANAVQRVQQTISELAQMFQKTAELVSDQEEMVQRIDLLSDETLTHVDQARESLFQHFKRMSSNRGLIIKVYLIIIFLVVFFICFIA